VPDPTRPSLRSIELRGIVKRFPGVVANDHVSLKVQAGEVHALLGENGAGKTTLMRILYGLYQPDEGEILLDDRPVRLHSPADSIRNGIGMIHQHFMLVPTLTVAENVALGLPSSRGVLLDTDRVAQRIRELATNYGLQVDPAAYVWQLSVGEQQRVEILKALYRGAQVLILDEPTAVLTPQEVKDLFVTLRRMVAEGHLLIFISHKLNEVLTISDRVTVLRAGRVVQSLATSATDRKQLARLMVGREVLLRVDRPAVEQGKVRLHLDDVWAEGDRGLPAVRGISLEVRAGEILGVAGVSGNGQRELAELIAGLRRPSSGKITLDEFDITTWEPDRRLTHGLAYIPEERMRDGVIRELSVEETLIRDHGRRPRPRHLPQLRPYRFGTSTPGRRVRDQDPPRSTPLRNLRREHPEVNFKRELANSRASWWRPSRPAGRHRQHRGTSTAASSSSAPPALPPCSFRKTSTKSSTCPIAWPCSTRAG
jgi:simple sugar transport system ATP-binding protein